MLKTYFKTAWRYLLNNKTSTFISIAGLAVGICCFLLLATYLLSELRYDRFHENADRIVRVGMHLKAANNDEARGTANTPTALVPVFKQQIAGVEDGVRIYNYSDHRPAIVNYAGNVFSEPKMLLADDSFFKIFSFKFLEGNARTAFNTPESVVITASTAKKYFGNDNAIGKILKVNQTKNLAVTGVIEDVPAYSQIKFDLMGNYAILDRSKTREWGSANDFSYLLLKPGADIRNVQQKINNYIANIYKDAIKAGNKVWYTIDPLTAVHLSPSVSGGLEAEGNISYIYILSVVAVILLILACINFLNLVTAKAADRAHEIGVRKVMGAERIQLFVQFITEAGLITLFSLLTGLLLTWLGFNWFNNFTDQQLSFGTWHLSWLIGALLALFVLVTLIAGTYPALYLSAFKPIVTMKGRGSNRSGNLRKGLVIFQFTVSVFFIICTMVVGSQLQYLQSADTGMKRSQVLVLNIGGMPYSQIETFKNAITDQPDILSSSASYDSPISVGGLYTLDKVEGKPSTYSLLVSAIPVEKNFTTTLGIKLIQGNSFTLADEKHVTVPEEKKRVYGFIINETAAKALGWKPKDAIGKRIGMNGREGTIKAVARDFNFASLHQEITPIVIFTEYDWFAKLIIKASGNNIPNTITKLKNSWKAFYPNLPFDYHFLDQDYENMYRAEQRTSNILNVFTGVTIFISCLGLFGLAVFTTKQRFKEVSIRKVMGASVANIVALISSDFMKLVFAAVLIASPLAWYAMDKWLQDFAFRIHIQWWVFAFAGFLSVLIAFITVSFQSVKAALLNPVKNLRSE